MHYPYFSHAFSGIEMKSELCQKKKAYQFLIRIINLHVTILFNNKNSYIILNVLTHWFEKFKTVKMSQSHEI